MTSTGAPSITCPACAITSYNPNDVSQGYCGRCHDWTGAVREMVVYGDIVPPDVVRVEGQPPELTQFIRDALVGALVADPPYLDRMVALLRAHHLPDTWEHGGDAYHVSYDEVLDHVEAVLAE